MKEVDFSLLNSAQENALKQINGAIMVLAGAGSGKTRLVTYRVAYLIKNLQVSPYNILAITFTNKATNEMRERLFNLLGDEAQDIWISTFHSMCVKILRRHISSLKSSKNLDNSANFDSNFSIYTDGEKEKAIKTVIENLGIKIDNFASKVSYHISNAKNKNLSPWEYKKLNQYEDNIDEITSVYSAYQNYLANNNALDFDDLLIRTYELFMEFPDILKRYQNRFMYIHVDEFQDTNQIQYQIVRLLALEHKNIFVVGDEDQCIYSWRGANIQNIRDFQKDFPGYKLLKLEQNYRSTKKILTLANKLIKNNTQRNDKILWTDNSMGDDILYYRARDEFSEAEFVANTIRRMVNYDNYKYSDFAVLTRLNAMTAPIEEKFLNNNIAYKVYGGNKFFDRLEIKNLVAYLKMLSNPYDSTSFSRIINFPKRGIGEATIKTLLELATFHNTTPYNLILNSEEYLLDNAIEKKIKPFKDIVVLLNQAYDQLNGIEFIKYLVQTVNFKSIYSTSSEEDLARLLNIDNFILLAQEYFKNNLKSTVSEFLQSITLITDMDMYDDKNNTVTLATVHAVKGLEFRVVFVIGLEEKMFPIIRAYSSSSDLEEERRLMFVAITRAKEKLFLSSANSRFMYGRTEYMTPSRFLKECELIADNFTGGYNNYNNNASSFNNSYLFTKPTYNRQSESKVNSFPTFSKKTSFSLEGSSLVNKKDELIEKKYAVGKTVTHPKFGKGVITINTGIALTKCVTIEFENFGRKTLSVEYAPITVVED